ncbi:MAG TPA: hypothetical protein VK192_05510 [Sphingomicrobium sp.]|jgi:uncharacterized membrane protein YozB (DUF420 family)|nr:hypothetical protein [Sphingomicrobium sp.]
MATITETSAAEQSRRTANPKFARSRYFLWLAVTCAAVAVLGFMPTYWLQLPAGTFVGSPLLHIHGALNTAWVLFLISQAWLISKGKVRNHRDWGLAGIALASMVVVVGYVAAIANLEERIARGEGDIARAFFATPVTAMTLFALFTAAAIACNHRPEWHKRLMITGTVSLVDAAAARFAFLIVVGDRPGLRPGLVPPPPEAMPTIVGLLLQLILVAGMVHDKRTRGSVHPAWIVGLAVSASALVLKVPLSHTNGWLAFADWSTRIAR